MLGAEALAALAVPVRLALLNHLLAAGPRTASQCAPVVGETASNCSWHLRALAKVGLVEPAPEVEGDGRTRPWQAAAVGFEFAGEGAGANVARRALAGMSAQHADEQYQRYLARQELLPPEWTKVSGSSGYALELTPDELDALVDRVEALVRPVRPHDPHRSPARQPRSCRSPCGRSSTPTCSRIDHDWSPSCGGRAWRASGLAGLLSEVGDWMLFIALPLFVLQLTGSALVTATVFALEMVPTVVAGPLAGRAGRPLRAVAADAERSPRSRRGAAAAARWSTPPTGCGWSTWSSWSSRCSAR